MASRGTDITVASEVMAILCLATGLRDLQKRLGGMTVACRRGKTPIFARDLKAGGAMPVLLRDAMQPTPVHTLENNPVFVPGGPFANIAHGCNSVIATRTALKLADLVVTRPAGAEKSFDIKCRRAGLHPDAAVLVATIRALKINGGIAKEDLDIPMPTPSRTAAPTLGGTSLFLSFLRAIGRGGQPLRGRQRGRDRRRHILWERLKNLVL